MLESFEELQAFSELTKKIIIKNYPLRGFTGIAVESEDTLLMTTTDAISLLITVLNEAESLSALLVSEQMTREELGEEFDTFGIDFGKLNVVLRHIMDDVLTQFRQHGTVTTDMVDDPEKNISEVEGVSLVGKQAPSWIKFEIQGENNG